MGQVPVSVLLKLHTFPTFINSFSLNQEPCEACTAPLVPVGPVQKVLPASGSFLTPHQGRAGAALH